MNREELARYIGLAGYNLGQVEKDYFQHIALGALSRRMAGLLVFKGGTALQKTGITRRFSEDLDFTLRKDASPENLRDAVLDAVRNYNYPADGDELVDTELAAGFRIKVHGPLYINGRGACTIRIEASRREKVMLEPLRKEFAPPYSDILPYMLDVMHHDEIAAEKCRALFTRQKSRDLYDLHRLLENGAKLRAPLMDAKLDYYGIAFSRKALLEKCGRLQKGWEGELSSLLEDVPAFERVIASIRKALRGTEA